MTMPAWRASLQTLWARYSPILVPILLILAFMPLALKYSYETQRLLDLVPGSGGIDLGFYVRWTHAWFSGTNIYQAYADPQGYPPASMLILYPFAGWLPMEGARYLWALTTIISFIVVAYIAIRVTDAKTLPQRLAIIFLALNINGTSVNYGNGQTAMLQLAFLLPAILLLHQRPVTFTNDLLAALLYVCSLIKPNLTIPYIWLLIIFPSALRVRPLILVSVIYLALSLYAATFVNTSLIILFQQFLSNRLVAIDVSLDPNLHYWVSNLGLPNLALPISALILILLGVWVYRHRTADLWLLLGVTTLVMRFWSYHQIYDSAFLIVPEIVLVQNLRRAPSNSRLWSLSAIFLAANILVTLPPGNLGGQAVIIQQVLSTSQAITWLATLLFFTLYPQTTLTAKKHQAIASSGTFFSVSSGPGP